MSSRTQQPVQTKNSRTKNALIVPDIKAYEANMGPIWGRQDPGGPHVGPMNFAIWVILFDQISFKVKYFFNRDYSSPSTALPAVHLKHDVGCGESGVQ